MVLCQGEALSAKMSVLLVRRSKLEGCPCQRILCYAVTSFLSLHVLAEIKFFADLDDADYEENGEQLLTSWV
jgi:hypothetical protein